MTRLTEEEIIARLEACAKELKDSPEKTREFFFNAGIYERDGQLKKEYQSS